MSAAREKRRSVRWVVSAGNILLAVFSALFTLAVAEVLARVYPPMPFSEAQVWPGFNDQLRGGFFVPDPEVGYRPGPAWAPAGRYGFRNGAEFDGTSEPATDIVLLGDSLIQDGVLGEVLKGYLAGTGARVWVAGIGGYNTLQEASYLERHIELAPDVLVLGFCLNDFTRSMSVVGAGQDNQGKFVTPDFEPLASVNPFLFRHCALYRLLQAALMSRSVRQQFSPEGVRHNRANVRRGLELMQRYAEQKRAQFLVILYPHLTETELPWQREATIQARRIFQELSLRYIDLTQAYAARGPSALRVRSADTVHPNREGHNIAAQTLLWTFPEIFSPWALHSAGESRSSSAPGSRP